jgi:CRP-like cAMP-binding protein
MLYVNARLLKQYGKRIKEGTVLCEEGQPGEHMFVIYSGKVRISKNVEGEEKTLVVLEDGAFFGEMSIILKEPRTATATCLTECEVLIIDANGFEAMVRKSPDMSLRIIKELANRLKASNETLAMLSINNPEERVVFYVENLAKKSDTEVEDGMQIVLVQNEILGKLSISEQQYMSAMEKLKRENLCYKIRHNFYVVPNIYRLRKFMEFLKMKRKGGA